MVPVKVGDVLEFDALSASGIGSSSPTKAEGRSLTTGRVVEVNPEDEGGNGTCTVQVSPYEPLQPLDLKRAFYKVVYEAGELRSLSSAMVSWEIELESADTKRLERGVVKQIDCDINCALVLFTGGRKEWLDLTFFRVKVPGHQTSPSVDGQGIELFDDYSKQYLKFKVAAQSNWSNEAFIFEPVENPPAQWEEYRRILVGHRVDVYDRVGKSVMNGKILAVGGSENSSDEPTLLVRFKDGHQSWIDLRTDKVKLRMHPATETTRASDEGPKTPPQASPRMESTNENGVASMSTSSSIPAVHPNKTDTVPPQPDHSQSLFRIPSGETPDNFEGTLPKTSAAPNPVSEPEVPATGGSPTRKPSPGKRVGMHRRASQSSDVPKVPLPADPVEPRVLPASIPIKEETPLAPAVSTVKPLSPLQSPRLDSHHMRPVSPGGPLPPVQPGSNLSSPSKTQQLAQTGESSS
ncbi:hypothetical protein PHYSODRAFT_329295 [Phytophthora sojae]|uniref:Uncharacterized protein n=1 Tax=Phytophthora sojae (strain P6497) TaxID=1094619 RepID=G4ZC35_PHYSP|nr:hypothetical protein PHYSODRAFT_329295 [Phytophthora sojae]EGZ21316.1 hypothetical protein PHYSODRAFT_329295 [Phytophthora sojae]|eukprot:XP_009524033.1 hypothetical protein PHYSODRAFT_329295 [Phytophthora sojae]